MIGGGFERDTDGRSWKVWVELAVRGVARRMRWLHSLCWNRHVQELVEEASFDEHVIDCLDVLVVKFAL